MTSAPATAAEPVGYIVHHRTGADGSRWRVIAEERTEQAAMARTDGPGDWWIERVYDRDRLRPDTLRPGLFE